MFKLYYMEKGIFMISFFWFKRESNGTYENAECINEQLNAQQ